MYLKKANLILEDENCNSVFGVLFKIGNSKFRKRTLYSKKGDLYSRIAIYNSKKEKLSSKNIHWNRDFLNWNSEIRNCNLDLLYFRINEIIHVHIVQVPHIRFCSELHYLKLN